MKGPRSLKLNEFASQLGQYESKLGWNWRDGQNDLMMFIRNTLKLLVRYEKKVSSVYGFPKGQCSKCRKFMKMEKRCIFEVNSEEYNLASLPVTVEHLITDLIKRNGNDECCVCSVVLEQTGNKFFIFQFSSPIDVQINREYRLLGKRLI